MKSIKSIQLKAAFLLIAFSLNTVIGFACAVGMNMDFNVDHHEEEVAISEISHHHSKVNEHKEKSVKDHRQSSVPDNCCHDKVTKVARFDKAVPPEFSISVNYLFLTTLASTFYHKDVLIAFRTSQIKYFVRSYHPPIADIRIAIQSFQI